MTSVSSPRLLIFASFVFRFSLVPLHGFFNFVPLHGFLFRFHLVFFIFVPLHGLPDFDFVGTFVVLFRLLIVLLLLHGWWLPSTLRWSCLSAIPSVFPTQCSCLISTCKVCSGAVQFELTPSVVGRSLMLASGLAGSSVLLILEAWLFEGARIKRATCKMVKIVGYLPMVVVLAWRMLSAAACESATRGPGFLPLWGLGSVPYSDSAPAVKCFHSNPTQPLGAVAGDPKRSPPEEISRPSSSLGFQLRSTKANMVRVPFLFATLAVLLRWSSPTPRARRSLYCLL